MNALHRQEGGSHYTDMPIQPVEYICKNGLGFIEGSVVKYVSRWRSKNGIEDLKKARHCLDLLIEMESTKTQRDERGEQLIKHGAMPNPSPETWANEWGEDAFGLWMALSYKGTKQLFRWIAPGKFIMGSPDTEPERWDDETPHEVTLTQGFWLADSACTQALWQAVMGDNPGTFKDNENNPVEHVRWNEVQTFIGRFNDDVEGWNARLPTGAEWEYTCRAGTTTPFYFGENITPKQVNYFGNLPYEGGEKGLYRQKPVPVKSLPPNPWGLYEMHGNVYDRCQDWYVADYGTGPQVDPQGPTRGVYRVVRGGSWLNDAAYCRSSIRRKLDPSGRDTLLGFRLALGQPRLSGNAKANGHGGLNE